MTEEQKTLNSLISAGEKLLANARAFANSAEHAFVKKQTENAIAAFESGWGTLKVAESAYHPQSKGNTNDNLG